ncbi:xaa-Pro aminopeptidase 3 [Drosophila ficusphila]|uniref:xaa-Pro aminopeptidase 3 n=1 Tax=Drosophila ficusphila TaxID=30025 RepID=UPI0007E6DA9A|nr:xaa-Pro aminopeptidase 3 [Drosophila ficusphila]
MNVLRRLDRLLPSTARRCGALATCRWRPQTRSSSSSGTPISTVDPAEVRGVAQILRKQKGNLGQPTCVSHPHLIQPDELVPGVEQNEFKERRSQLMQNIRAYVRSFGGEFNGHSSPNHMLVLGAASKKYMSGKIPYVFRQNSDFYYLTGCLEPDAVLLLTIDEQQNVQSELFMRPKDPHAELWDGPRTGPELAVPLFGVTEAHPLTQLDAVLTKRVGALKPHIWFDAKNSDLPSLTENMQRLSGSEQRPLLPAYTFLEASRLLKSRAEMQLMRRTCDIASRSFNEVMAESRPGQSEHHLFAAIDYKCRMRNASYLAYPPVVAAGKNATVIHYVSNSQLVGAQDLVLMDAGCEYGGYTSDITRTWPASGHFTEPQRTLYEMVHQLQGEIIATVMKPGGETLDQLFETTCYKLGKYLQEIGLVSKSVSDYKELAGQGYRFCPHHVSHYLGMDVHDTPHVPRNTRLVPGMVFTVEPGIYIGQDCGDVPPEFRGIGIRIEDDLLINEHGQVEVLTEACVKDPRALQELCQKERDSGASASLG